MACGRKGSSKGGCREIDSPRSFQSAIVCIAFKIQSVQCDQVKLRVTLLQARSDRRFDIVKKNRSPTVSVMSREHLTCSMWDT